MGETWVIADLEKFLKVYPLLWKKQIFPKLHDFGFLENNYYNLKELFQQYP